MKYRADFVTNSSSSSFVIAVRKDITEKILKDLLTPVLKDQFGYEYEDDEKQLNKEINKNVNKAWKIINKKPTAQLGDWNLFCAFNYYDGGDEYFTYSALSEIENCEYIKGVKESE